MKTFVVTVEAPDNFEPESVVGLINYILGEHPTIWDVKATDADTVDSFVDRIVKSILEVTK